MRKGLLIVFGLLIIFAFMTVCFATEVSQQVYSVSLRNNTATHKDYLIPVTTIRPEVDKLWGYDAVPIKQPGGNTETWISIFDSTDSLMTGECFGEQEADDNGSIKDRWPRGKWIVHGVAARVGAFTDATIYFIRK